MDSHSVYVHVPFCTHRCGYCDFNTYAGLENLIPRYVDALIKEVRFFSQAAGSRLPIHSIFFGGGTPSLLPMHEIERVLNELESNFDFSSPVEITLEANPGTLSYSQLKGLGQLGINRLSMGVQSAKPEDLRVLERQHNFGDAINAVKWARQAGFDNINLDWIFGLPGQSLESWDRNLEMAMAMNPEHLALYALSIEHGTPFRDMSDRGVLALPDADLAADMYELAMEKLGKAGYVQYEISNWAKLDVGGKPFVCRHNLQYWRNLPYVGLGAGAHGYVAGRRTVNTLGPGAYIQRLQNGIPTEFPSTPATASLAPVGLAGEMGETMMMGLRLVQEGVSKSRFKSRFDSSLEDHYGSVVQRLLENGLLTNGTGDAIKLTHRGKMLGNQVFMEFV